MKIALIGPELEENLGLRYLHASLVAAGHNCRIIDFHGPEQTNETACTIIDWKPDMVGLSMVFTARAREYIDLANLLRARGFSGRIVAGGHFASFHSAEILSKYPAFDYIVHGEGEIALVDLAASLATPQKVAGISYRGTNGEAVQTSVRPNPDDLDLLPWPTRTPPFYRYLGIPIANVLGSRGCFGNCSFCSITAWYRQNTGKRFRQRSAHSIAMEMAHLYNAYGVRIFNFHDDTFFLSNEARDLERFSALEGALQALGLTDIAVQVKARTDAITPAVLDGLQRIGLFRVFLGVENFSAQGLKSLGKGTTVDENRRALRLLRDRGLHVTFNLLMFGPDTTVRQLRENIQSIREFDDMPVNFGRVEVYSGTPLERDLRAQGRLKGDWLGYHYDIADPIVQNMFEVFRTVFTERNFQVTGTNFQAMKLDYYHQILAHFRPHQAGDELRAEKTDIIRRLNRSNADLLARICEETGTDGAANRRLASRLLDIRRSADRKLTREFGSLIRRIECVSQERRTIMSAGKVAALSAAVAILASTQRCVTDEAQPTAPLTHGNPDTLGTHVELPNLDSSEVALVWQRINSVYKTGIDSVGASKGLVNQTLQFNLCLDSSGKVDSSDIIVPAVDPAPGFSAAVQSAMSAWRFPEVGRRGKCGITMIVNFLDTDWHMCEIIGYPIDTQKVEPLVVLHTPLEYTGADSQLVMDRYQALYYGSVFSLCSKYNCLNREFSIFLDINMDGSVTECRTSIPSNAISLPDSFCIELGSLASGWTFPGVSRAGFLEISAGVFVVPPTIYEMMAFPKEKTGK